MNIKLHYQYRDAGNYKNFSDVIFKNDTNVGLAHIDVVIRECLIDGTWFVADKWNLPDLHFKEFDWDSELDHDWHEFESVEETVELSTKEEDVTAFIERIHSLKQQDTSAKRIL